MKVTTIEQELADSGRCVIQTVGTSMEPLLHNRYSSVVIETPSDPLKRGDVVLCKRAQPSGGDFLLHRVIRVGKEAYRTRGDNSLVAETVRAQDILGVMTGFFNGDDYVDCRSDEAYARYVKSVGWRFLIRRSLAFCKEGVKLLRRLLKRGGN